MIQNCTWQRHSLAPPFLAEKLLDFRQAIAVVVFSVQPLTKVHRATCGLINRRAKHRKSVPQIGQFVIVAIASQAGNSFQAMLHSFVIGSGVWVLLVRAECCAHTSTVPYRVLPDSVVLAEAYSFETSTFQTREKGY